VKSGHGEALWPKRDNFPACWMPDRKI
jgi:hypothetical protein